LNKGKDRDTYLELQQFTIEILSQGGGVHARQEMQHFVTTLQYYIMFEVGHVPCILDTLAGSRVLLDSSTLCRDHALEHIP
jgi:hypothetical protein